MRRIPPTSLLRQRLPPLSTRSNFPTSTLPLASASASSSSPRLCRAASEYIPGSSSSVRDIPLDQRYKSLEQTLPHKVRQRREWWPVHPERSFIPLADPEFLSGEPTNKRLPLKLEDEFDEYRALGFFPGTEEQARRDFLESAGEWRSRQRGFVTEIWDSEKRRWVDRSKLVHHLRQSRQRGNQVQYSPVDEPLRDVQELYLAGKIWPTYEDILADDLRIAMGYAVDPTTVDLSSLHDKLQVVNWAAVEERTPTAEADPALWSRVRDRLTGYRIYLPNVTVIMRRNKTPPNEPYNPMIASFRIPLSMTKTDLRSYLKALYDLDITFIRTDVRRGRIIRDRRTRQKHRQRGPRWNYKRAVVGLKEPFHYPDDVEELRAMGHADGVGEAYAKQYERTVRQNFSRTGSDEERSGALETRRRFESDIETVRKVIPEDDRPKPRLPGRGRDRNLKFQSADRKRRERMQNDPFAGADPDAEAEVEEQARAQGQPLPPKEDNSPAGRRKKIREKARELRSKQAEQGWRSSDSGAEGQQDRYADAEAKMVDGLKREQ